MLLSNWAKRKLGLTVTGIKEIENILNEHFVNIYFNLRDDNRCAICGCDINGNGHAAEVYLTEPTVKFAHSLCAAKKRVR